MAGRATVDPSLYTLCTQGQELASELNDSKSTSNTAYVTGFCYFKVYKLKATSICEQSHSCVLLQAEFREAAETQ
jgi:hypothetical protein